MKWIWKPVDRIGMWILHEFGALGQLRLGVILTLGSLPFYPYMFWSGEPPVIYFLSVVATTLSGMALIVGTQILYNQEEEKKDNDTDV